MKTKVPLYLQNYVRREILWNLSTTPVPQHDMKVIKKDLAKKQGIAPTLEQLVHVPSIHLHRWPHNFLTYIGIIPSKSHFKI